MSWTKWLDRLKRRVFVSTRETAHEAGSIPLVSRTTFRSKEHDHWYQPVMMGPGTLSTVSTDPVTLSRVYDVLEKLEPDDYVRYLLGYYQTGLARFDKSWRYADIVTVLMAASTTIHPQSYLEIGVRRGRSMAIVAATNPDCMIVGFDMWQSDYAGMSNPGSEFVRAEMRKLGHKGELDLVSGDSHKTVPRYFSEHPGTYFDLITVDGDHSEKGSEQDLRDVIPRLKVGGVLVFDDIFHPKHPYLADVWDRAVKADKRFTTWEYTDIGFGVAAGIRKEA